MAVMVLISTMGITINMHFCHDQLIDLAFYSPAKSCCNENHEVPCDPREDLAPMNHCENDSVILEALEDFVGSSFAINLDSKQSTDVLFYIALKFKSTGIYEDIKSIIPDYDLPPPYQEVDLSQIQSYLI